MKKSLITQRIIAKSFKTLMVKDSFEQISVRDIMGAAGIRRQTFYNYFLDKDELLHWIFETEFYEALNDNLDYYNWKKVLQILLGYLNENLLFYRKVFFLIPTFDRFFLEQFLFLLDKVISDEEKKSSRNWSDLDKKFIRNYHAAAICSLCKEEIIKGNSLEDLYASFLKELIVQMDVYKV